MSVITTLKLDDFVAASESARQPDRSHGGFCAGVDHTDTFDAWDQFADCLGELSFSDCG